MTVSGFPLENTYTKLPEVFFSKLSPSPVSQPEVVIFNDKLANEIGLDLSGLNEEERTKLLSGNLVPEGTEPFAQAYAGHQFGNFTMLGDGRAIILGEHLTPSGQRLDLQFKGSGRTPYSRGGDGRAALGPMLREYAVSEAMHALGIPTTRSLAVVTTGERSTGKTNCRGNPTRIARCTSGWAPSSMHPSMKTRPSPKPPRLPDRPASPRSRKGKPSPCPARSGHRSTGRPDHPLDESGLYHGVMNTDNMALSGETIDYGPWHSWTLRPRYGLQLHRSQGRYAYANHPSSRNGTRPFGREPPAPDA